MGHLYERALAGERCWVRHDDGRVRPLAVGQQQVGPDGYAFAEELYFDALH